MSKFEKGKSGNPRGRPPGSSNKVPTILKEAIIKAAELAGGEEGLTGYLQAQANANPSARSAAPRPYLAAWLPNRELCPQCVGLRRLRISI